jgi:hypothetical protein
MADLESRIGLLEDDVIFLCRAISLASLREYDLLHGLGIPADTYHRDQAELGAMMGLLPSASEARN